MTPLVSVGLAAFFLAILLHLFLFSIVLARRPRRAFELSLLWLLGCLLIWYGGNFLSLLLRQMDLSKVGPVLLGIDAAAIVGLGLTPPLLLQTNWIYFTRQGRPGPWESRLIRLMLALLYGQLILLIPAFSRILARPAETALDKLGPFTFPFLSVLAAAYWVSSYLDFRIVQTSRSRTERALFQRLAAVFILVPFFNFFVFLGTGRASLSGQSLLFAAQLASVLPSVLVTYYIRRYRFLQIEIHRSIVVVAVTLTLLAAYLIGVRRLGQFMQEELGAPPLLVEGTLVAALLLLFSPLSRYLERRVDDLFRGEIRRVHALVEVIKRSGLALVNLELRKEFIEHKIREDLQAARVAIRLSGEPPSGPVLSYPLVAEDQSLGYLEIEPGDREFSSSKREALAILAEAIALDLRRSQLLESELRVRQELSERSHMAEIGRMTAGIAHNVKNPLSSMKTLLQLMREAGNLTSDQQKELEMVVAEINRLSETVGSLLKFSRLDSPAEHIHLSEVALPDLVETVRGVFRGDLESRRLRLQTLFELETPSVQSDPNCLSDILSNLLSNAIEASRSESHITLQMRRSGTWLEIIVEDQGPGIPARIREKLFEPFVTTKARGTGLGLAIVKKRVEQLEGLIEVVSPVNSQGTRFTVRVPYREQGRAA